jgi:hypothetical protein
MAVAAGTTGRGWLAIAMGKFVANVNRGIFGSRIDDAKRQAI